MLVFVRLLLLSLILNVKRFTSAKRLIIKHSAVSLLLLYALLPPAAVQEYCAKVFFFPKIFFTPGYLSYSCVYFIQSIRHKS